MRGYLQKSDRALKHSLDDYDIDIVLFKLCLAQLQPLPSLVELMPRFQHPQPSHPIQYPADLMGTEIGRMSRIGIWTEGFLDLDRCQHV